MSNTNDIVDDYNSTILSLVICKIQIALDKTLWKLYGREKN